MSKGNYLSALLRSPKTVFSTKDIALLWHEPATTATQVRLNYFVKKGDLYHIRKGLYARDENYSRLELATRIFTPAYVSFETVLVKEGLIFQYYQDIFVASYVSRKIMIDQQVYFFRKIKNEVLVNPSGIEFIQETSIASKERAFLDTLYSKTQYHFDNLRSLDWKLVFELLPIYQNQSMVRRVNAFYQNKGD